MDPAADKQFGHRQFVYRIDAEDVLVEVDEPWLDFAHENWRQGLAASDVLGKRLWACINDHATRYIYQLLVKRVRESGGEVTIPFRCDSPDTRRFMDLRISPRPQGGVEFRARILRQEKRAPAQILGLDMPRADLLLAMCSWCKRIRVPEWVSRQSWRERIGAWCEVELLGDILEGLHLEYPPEVSHTVCRRGQLANKATPCSRPTTAPGPGGTRG